MLGPSRVQPGTYTANTQGANLKQYTIQTNKHELHDHNWCQSMLTFLILNHICMSVGQVHVHHTTFLSSTSRWHVPGENNKIFKGLPNAFDVVYDIVILGYNADGRNHDRALRQVKQVCCWENLKLNKNKCHFKYSKIPFVMEVISGEGIQPHHKKLHALTEMLPLQTKRNYL